MNGRSVSDLLGGKQAIGADLKRELDFDKEIKRGFRVRVFARFKENTQLPNSVLSRALGVSMRTIDRLVAGESAARIKPAVSDRLYRNPVACGPRVFRSSRAGRRQDQTS